VSAFKVEQHRVSIKRRTFHFVSYESVPANEKSGEPALPSMWYLMGPGKRWPVMPHIPGQADAEVDLELRRWIEEQGLGRRGLGN